MPIAFICPHCKKSYKLKDEVAGKRVTCSGCRKTAQVPAAAAPVAAKPVRKLSSAEADELAARAFAEETTPKSEQVETVAEGAPIKLKCRFCDHDNVFEARFAGKNAPCQNDECRKILKVPVPQKTGPKDWRQVEKKLPTLARRDNEQIEGAWGNVETAAVSREALVGARADEVEEDDETPKWPRRLRWGAIAVVTVGVLVWAVLYGLRKYDDYRAGRAMQTALAFEYKDPKTGEKKKLDKPQAGVVKMLAGMQDVDLNKAKDAKAKLEDARGGLEPVNTFERSAMLVEIAALLTDLSGTRAESEEGKRLEWDRDKLGAAVRATLSKLPPIAGDDGRDMRSHACRIITRRLAGRNHIAAAIQMAKAIAPPEEQGEMLAVAGLELLALGQRDKAEELAQQASAAGVNDGATSLIALWMAIAAPDAPDDKKKLAADKIRIIAPPPGKEPALSATTRVGYAAGMARQGALPNARALAWQNGKSDDRLRAGIAVAAVAVAADAKDHRDLDACMSFIETEYKERATPPWLLLRLAEIAIAADRLDLAEKIANAIKEPGLKSWAHFEIVRKKTQSTEPADFAWADAAGDPDRLGHALAVAAIARQRARVGSRGKVFNEINKWPDERNKLRAFGYAGIALSNTEWR